ncbi:kinase-like domain-containing protein [Chaetomium fimeti]|uniref:Kinase-like domain-containing protein n=1 Tax=Chaetomium fimeti TaxID=1854472 RepID=A0AAE0HBC3_9PEZI|nr:kinase-like domain-containing protein [Chaetomium fimeti]
MLLLPLTSVHHRSKSQFLPMDRDVLEDQRWPPAPPDVAWATIEREMPELVITGNSTLYKVKGHAGMVYKSRGDLREYELQKAAGDCAIPVRGRVMTKVFNGDIACMGFLMDLATPIIAPTGPAPPPALVLPPSQRRDIMYQMVSAVQRLHTKRVVHGDLKLENMLLDNQGKLRLCDFAEGRYVDEDESLWEGSSTWHYESPNRLLRGEQVGMDPAPPTTEDDLYGLGLSIWHLYTGKMPHEDLLGDDLGLKERQRNGETVDVAKVDDPEAREIIRGFLRLGGARI